MAELVIIEANDTLTHVALRGRLDLTGVENVEVELAKQTVARRKPAIVDISAVDILASIGVGMLVKNAGKRPCEPSCSSSVIRSALCPSFIAQ